MSVMRLGILVSGRGSNLEAVLDAVLDGRLPGVEPVLVISNRPGVRAVRLAAGRGVPVRILRLADHTDRDARDAAIGRALVEAGVELALLAGYDRLLQRSFFEAFPGRTMNVHPSLLPRHGGKGMLGLAVHAAVLAAGDVETGATVHWVTPELDAGPPLAQDRLAVRPGETAEELAGRVLAIEHRLVVRVLAELAAERGLPGASGSMTAASQAPARLAGTEQRSRFDA